MGSEINKGEIKNKYFCQYYKKWVGILAASEIMIPNYTIFMPDIINYTYTYIVLKISFYFLRNLQYLASVRTRKSKCKFFKEIFKKDFFLILKLIYLSLFFQNAVNMISILVISFHVGRRRDAKCCWL